MESESDVLDVCVNEEDMFCVNQTEETPLLHVDNRSELENDSKFNELIFELRSIFLKTKVKTVFWRIVQLIIFEIEGKIPINQFETSIRNILMDFTKNMILIDRLTGQTLHILVELKRFANPFTHDGKVFHDFNVERDDGKLRHVNNDDKVKLENLFDFAALEDILKLVDFGFVSRIQIALTAVITEVGFADFSTLLKQEVYKIKAFDETEVLPVYGACFDYVTRSTVSMCHRTYGTLSNKLYLMVKQFVDKLYY